MTEEDWLTETEPYLLLTFLEPQIDERKLRLYLCACSRRAGEWLSHFEIDAHYIETAELFADGRIARSEFLTKAEQCQLEWRFANRGVRDTLSLAGWCLQAELTVHAVGGWAEWATSWGGREPEREDGERAFQTSFLRDIFGNPFRPVTFDPAWRTEAVTGIASAIYEDRAFERLPILADALQEAGCENEDILTHCREPGEHVRGCWVVDLVLGKA